ncbi:DUF7740 domain-containing protein [Raoultella planticola]|uniref:DUF7740 domain-containing protein n=1 Tax=Raoultella planticola TaxID=575 RepID=UPI0004598632|nr:hypothetical protein [Raoultella planticola]KAJ97217.1 hypothetical protein DF41_24760 [Raoultella planticola]
MKMKPANAREFIQMEYSEFPDTVLHAELCRACARSDGRNIKRALNGFARARTAKVKNPALRATLKTMATSQFPEAQITRIRACIGRMESALVQKFGVKRS